MILMDNDILCVTCWQKGKIDANCKYCLGTGGTVSKEFRKGFEAGKQFTFAEVESERRTLLWHIDEANLCISQLKQQLAGKDKELVKMMDFFRDKIDDFIDRISKLNGGYYNNTELNAFKNEFLFSEFWLDYAKKSDKIVNDAKEAGRQAELDKKNEQVRTLKDFLWDFAHEDTDVQNKIDEIFPDCEGV